MRRTSLVLTVAAILTVFAAGDRVAAFSRIDPGEGRSDSREGIIAVPLPPLPSPHGTAPAAVPEPSSQEEEGTDAGEEPLPPAHGPNDALVPSRQGDPTDDNGIAPTPLREGAATAEPLAAEIAYGDDALPRPVRDLRAKLMEIARSGEIERLRPYIETGDDGTVLTFGPTIDDPIEFLKASSGDGEGVETLAIMLEILEAGHARVEPNASNEIFVWPYFTQVHLEDLTPPQKVELFELVTAGDYQGMLDFGGYNFYRLGISPDGRLAFFVAGD
ncbi:hypothetical protein GTW51_08070 [Aurantimonas aggregata]|uniref:Uncharacterized protein n=1 Tax=Aurantimonas aggregata TaxID=2047720 RepID=A0A6L9MFU0_9HYPH|nr:hypothetical protein [Aurantimonas aggregata]NDV86655.1 hypothetical protein [Aurantimonas aggregata]